MSEPLAPIVWIGTRDGLLRWQAGGVTPIVSEVAVTALALLPGGQVAAGLGSGECLVAGRDGRSPRRITVATDARVSSVVALAGRSDSWWVGTASGALLELRNGGTVVERRWQAPAGPLHVLPIPDRPRSALLLVAGHGLWLLPESGREPTRWRDDDVALLAAIGHPFDGQVWLARTASQLLRSIDGARTFRPVAGWPATLRPRAVQFGEHARSDAYALSWPLPLPPDPVDPSPIWKSVDGGQSFHPVPSRQIDTVRDPVGELTCIASWLERGRQVVVLASDRGELLAWDGGAGQATLLADSLPPIDHLLATGPAPLLDPSSSGIFLLP